MYDQKWCKQNDERATVAMRCMAVWYQPPHVPPPEFYEDRHDTEVIDDTKQPEKITKPEKPMPQPEKPRREMPQTKAQAVIKAVAEITGIKISGILGLGRHKSLVDARRVISWILIKEMGLSYPTVGRLLSRDHSTIINQIRTCQPRHHNVIAAVMLKLKHDGIFE